MQKASGPQPRKAFRDNYLAAVWMAVLLLCSLAGSAQIIQYPNPGTYGTGEHRRVIDSTLYFPTGCGAPSGIASLRSYGFTGFGQKIRQAAIYADTCGHSVYWFDWTDSTWVRFGAGGSGTGSADSLKHIFVDTGSVANNAYYLGFDSVNRKWKLYALSPFTTTTPGIVNPPGAFNSRIFPGADNTWRTAVIPTDTAGKWVGWGYRSHDSIYLCKGGIGTTVCTFAWRDTTGTTAAFDSATTQGGGFHTDGFNLATYKRIQDSSAASGYVTHTALNDSVQANADTTDYREIGATGVHPFYLTLNPHHTILAIPKMRGLPPIKVAANGTDSVTEVSADTSSANTALATLGQLQKRIDSLGGVTNTALAGKVANNGASTGIKAGTYASRPAASNCQCYYWSTDSAWYSYDNGSWKDLKPGSGSGGGGSAYVLDSVQTVTSGSAVTIGNGISILVINPSSPISSLAVTLPATPRACGYVKLVYGGTMTTGNTVVSNLTITANAGQTLIRNGTVGTVSAGDQAIVLNNISNTWYNEQ